MSDENTKQNDPPYSSLEGLIDEIVVASQGSHTRKFCFVLGAGASLESGIPASEILVKQWDQTLQNRYGEAHQTWLRQHGIDDSNRSDHYCKYYGKVYEGDRRTAGLNFLESLMEGKVPSFGYAVLADFLVNTTNNMVVTTNFDHLLEDAITYYTDKIPFVIGHDTLAAYMGIDIKRPVIVKVHGDLRFAPANSEDEVGKLSPAWEKPLKAIMENYHLVFMGYAGNDAGLMDFLTEQAENPGQKMLTPYWMLYSGTEPSEKILTFVRTAKGEFVRHQGFDHFMLKLGAKAGYRTMSRKGFLKRAWNRWTIYQNQLDRAGQKEVERQEPSNREKGTEKNDTSECPSPPPGSSIMDDLKTIQGNVISPSVFLADIWSEPYDHQKKRIEEAMQKYPSDAWIMGTYALIETEAKHADQANDLYQQALKIDPQNVRNLGNYATFLCNNKQDMDRAEEFYKQAIDADPKHTLHLGNYATFLCDNKKDMAAAEEFYKRAIDADPKHANNLGNYANFLCDDKQDMAAAEEFYKRAIDADPKHALHLGNYAVFLKNEKKDMAAAEEFYKRAIDADPKHALHLSNYAVFLCDNKKDMAAADEFYKRAIDADPKDSTNLGNYALFLENDRKNPEQAETIYKSALERCPDNVRLLRLYARFLRLYRKNKTKAQELEKRADWIEKNSPS